MPFLGSWPERTRRLFLVLWGVWVIFCGTGLVAEWNSPKIEIGVMAILLIIALAPWAVVWVLEGRDQDK